MMVHCFSFIKILKIMCAAGCAHVLCVLHSTNSQFEGAGEFLGVIKKTYSGRKGM